MHSATALRSIGVFTIFLYFNSIIFLSSIASLVFLVPPEVSVGAMLAVYSIYLCFGYFSSLMIITQASDRLAKKIIFFTPFFAFIGGVAFVIAPIGLGYWLKLRGLGFWLKLRGRKKKYI